MHFDTILKPNNHDALRDGIEYNKFFGTKSTNQLKSPQKSLFHFIERRYLIYNIVDFMHAQNGDMSVLPSLHMQLLKNSKGHFDAKMKIQI